MVGIRISFWGPAYFQGRAVSLLECMDLIPQCLKALQGDGEGPDVPAGKPVFLGGLERENGLFEMGYGHPK